MSERASKAVSVINRAQVKKFTLEVALERWPDGKMSRVSDEFLRDVEIAVKSLIRKKIEQHPTVGKTIR